MNAHGSVRRAGALCVALAFAATTALAQSVATRRMQVRWSGHTPLVGFAVDDFLTPEVVRKLKSGLPQTLVTRVYAYSERNPQPLAVSARSCRVVFDLWEEVYRVQQEDERRDRHSTTRKLDEAVASCLRVSDMPIGDGLDAHHGERVYFAVIVELNPLSPDTVRRIRRWLSRSSGQQLQGDAFFGSFVSIFVSRQMGTAERSVSFRSPTLDVPP